MAKWGQGDPRWIVEERTDAHNVNNWHWKEVDTTEFSKTFLKDTLSNIVIDDPLIGRVKITNIESIEGDATCSIRKQKFIHLFDFPTIKCTWIGNVNGLETNFSGTILIGDLDHDSDEDELDYTIKFKKEIPVHQTLKKMIEKNINKNVWPCIKLYKETCKTTFGEKLVLNKDENISNDSQINSPVKVPLHTNSGKNGIKDIEMSRTSSTNGAISKSPTKTISNKMDTKKVTLTDKFLGKKEDVYNAFVDISKIMAWSQNSLKLTHASELEKGSNELNKNTKFDLFSGNVSGAVINKYPNDKLELTWRLKQWPESHFSNVELKFKQENDGTLVVLEQSLVPSAFVQNTTEGWKRYYFNAIKNTFGMGRRMF